MKHQHVLAIGNFDLFHIGHLRYLQFARAQGHYLSVAVTPDDIGLVIKNKVPIIPEAQRMEIIRGLGWVDNVALLPTTTENTPAAAEWIQAWGVGHVVAGGCWEGSERWGRLVPALAARGISVEFAPHTDGISTTGIVAAIREGAGEPKAAC